MTSILLTFCLLGMAVAYPQGYDYPKQTSRGVVGSGSAVGEEGYSRDVPSGPVFNNDLQTPVVVPNAVPTSAPLPVKIFKHVHVHVAPDEPDVIRPKFRLAAPQKHFKIIFIKPPGPPTYAAPVLPAQPQDQEKTLVYVLSKKAEAADDIVVPTSAPAKQNKPEVFFIKYKTNQEAKQEVVATAAPKVEERVKDSYEGSLPTAPVRGSVKYGPPSKKYLPQKKY